MAPDQWTITKKKNVSNFMAEGQPRKRARLSVAPSHEGRRQQTLTQAQWIPSRSPSFQDESHLKPIKGRPGRITSRARVKRDSTLTQMDFFRDMHVKEELDDMPLGEVDDAAANLPWLDGSDDCSAKATSQERPARPTVNSKTAIQRSRGDSQQDYKPAKKRRSHSGATSVPERNVRRMSSRLADKEDKSNKLFADPSNAFGEASGQNRVLEVQDSTDTEVDDIQLAPQSQPSRRPAALPETPPNTAKMVILSSQSPEREECLSLMKSGRRSGARKAALVEEECMRSPLREKSVNLLSRPRTCTKLRRTTPRARKATSSPASKIVSLKLPKRSVHTRRIKVEDSQALWSLPISSSPAQGNQLLLLSSRSSPELSRAKSSVGQGCLLPPAEEAGKEEWNGTEIPGTSQAEGEVYLGETPPSEADVAVEQGKNQGQQTEQLSGVLVRDFAPATSHTASSKEKDEGAGKNAAPPKTPLLQAANRSKRDEQEEDSDIDFDSPIANDTQFNVEVARRTTTTTTMSSSLSSFPHDTVSEDSFVIPTPRLVRSASRPRISQANELQQLQQASKRSYYEGILPPVPQTGTTTTTLVPLNDTLMGPPLPQPPSSSPQLHSHTSRPTTQRSGAAEVRPASMPHPSQISTQEATQFGLLSSLVPAPESPEAAVKKERITIKDSSSIAMLPLSQIPPAERESQGVDLGLEEEEEIDLDDCLNDHHHDQHHGQFGGDVVVKKKVDDVAPRTRIKQESQLDQSAVEQERGGAEETESQTLSPQSPSSPTNHNHDHHSPIPGFNNETQSNFTQGGHVTAAYIHRQRDLGMLPKWYTPKPYRVPGYTRR